MYATISLKSDFLWRFVELQTHRSMHTTRTKHRKDLWLLMFACACLLELQLTALLVHQLLASVVYHLGLGLFCYEAQLRRCEIAQPYSDSIRYVMSAVW